MNKKCFLPTESILLKTQKNNKTNYFDSLIFFKDIKPFNALQKNKEKQDEKLLDDLKEILKCPICLSYLEDPVYDPKCSHYGCKKCLYEYFDINKTKIIRCPQCRGIINKDNLIELPIIKSIKEIINNSKNTEILDFNNDEDEKCYKHTDNEVFFLCLDCKLKMCPICDEERRKHEQKNHHIVNFKRYIKLFYILNNNFKPLKKFISEKQKTINEYKYIIALMEQQKQTYLDLFNEFSKNIEK